jgi:DNA-binding MarR family transcriptional regulator|tara:strand:+ start:374 stop:859 length:486 start_codon:yes stop_codon:yes gene_type:complete
MSLQRAGNILTDALTQKLQAFTLRNAPGHLIRRCQQRAVDLFVEEVGESGPNTRQFAVLINVFQNPGMSQTALVEASGIDRSTLTEVLKRMIDRGMISKARAREDQRTNALFLTGAGVSVLKSTFEAAERAQLRILKPLSVVDRSVAMSILEALAGGNTTP